MVAMVIITVLTLSFLSANSKQVKNANIAATVQALELAATDFDRVISDGTLILSVGDTLSIANIQEYLYTLEAEYLSFSFDIGTLKITSDGFTVKTLDLLDGFNQAFTFYFSAKEQRIIMMSAGPDMVSNPDTYVTGDFGDDIISIIKER